GNPHNPLSDDEIAAKFQALASPVLGARANEIEEVVGTLETRPIGDLLRLLGQP
ncbi:MAG TPA: 2-methylcitrate dehydratase, partial [Cobetia sp.]|nr:2-methylcitrate dehydratase [Cobetia sp.]